VRSIDPKKASEETTELKRKFTQGREATRTEAGQKIRDGSRRWCLALAGRRPCRKSGQSRGGEDKRETIFRGPLGRVGVSEMDGAEGAESFNEFYQLVVACHQSLGPKGARDGRAKSEEGAGWVEVQDRS
jgi:hypothetical protein